MACPYFLLSRSIFQATSNRSRSSIPVGPRHGDPAHRYFRGIPAWRRGLLSALWHGDPAHRCFRGILAWQSVLLTGPRHGDPFHRYLGGIPVWRMASRPVHDRQLTDALTGLRHGDPAYRHLRAIPAWRRGLLSALWHGDSAHRYFSGIPAGRTASRPIHDQSLTDHLPMLWLVFGRAL